MLDTTRVEAALKETRAHAETLALAEQLDDKLRFLAGYSGRKKTWEKGKTGRARA